MGESAKKKFKDIVDPSNADPRNIGENIGRVGELADEVAQDNGFAGGEDFLTQTLSGGLLEVMPNGDVKGGPIVDQYDEFVGEISGRNARRGELHRQEGLLIQQRAERERLLAEEANARRLDDVNASRTASSGRRSSGSSRSSGGSGGTFSLGDQRDFLGL